MKKIILSIFFLLLLVMSVSAFELLELDLNDLKEGETCKYIFTDYGTENKICSEGEFWTTYLRIDQQ